MAYTAQEMARLAGVSTRTLRYYEERGLISPHRQAENGYRLYGEVEVERLQRILFLRERQVSIEDIGTYLNDPKPDMLAFWEAHLLKLMAEQNRTDVLIRNVQGTINALRGKAVMTDKKRFEGLKEKRIRENEEKYGREIRQRYSEGTIDRSNARLRGMDQQAMDRADALSSEIMRLLSEALLTRDPAGDTARALCQAHREWILMYWPEGTYTPDAHKGLAEMYVADERFKAFYAQAGEGAAQFLCDALTVFLA